MKLKKILTSVCAVTVSLIILVVDPFNALAASHHTERFRTGNAKFESWLVWDRIELIDGYDAVEVDAKTKDKTYTITFANVELYGSYVAGGSFHSKKECSKPNRTAIAEGGGRGYYTVHTKHWITNRAKGGWSKSIGWWESDPSVSQFSEYN